VKIKGRIEKLHRININAISCDVASFDKLKNGKTINIPEKAAKELINMGVAEQAENKKTKKESKNG
tara:strand:+ start:408 stop:605 length:198 start_codon:yes stop_codon:yes gene_type:complete